MTTGHRIKAARTKVGLTQKELGAKLGVSESFIAQYETDKRNPKKETLQRIADALGIHVSELLITFTPEIEEILILAEDNAEKLFGLDKTEVHQRVMDGIREIYLPSPQERINRFLNRLNDEGQQKAVERVKELTEIPRYRAETAPHSPSAPQEGTDTTPPADAPETPPEGE